MIASSMIKVGERGLRVTVSIGATLARTDDDPAALIQRADGLMYQSKQNGRNLVTLEA